MIIEIILGQTEEKAEEEKSYVSKQKKEKICVSKRNSYMSKQKRKFERLSLAAIKSWCLLVNHTGSTAHITGLINEVAFMHNVDLFTAPTASDRLYQAT